MSSITAPSNPSEQLPLPVLSCTQGNGLTWFTDKPLEAACSVRIAFTTRHGGFSVAPYEGLDLASHVGDDPRAVQANRMAILDALGLRGCADALVNPNQVHGTEVNLAVPGGNRHPDADAVLCLEPLLPVLLCFADCLPALAVVPGGAFCVMHAGWRGALGGICGKGVSALCEHASCSPSQVNVYIGAHIRECCYQTSDEILAKFVGAYGDACAFEDRHLSLSEAVRCDLLRAGVDERRIAEVPVCTSCNTTDFFSYRAEKGVCGRHGVLACRLVRAESGISERNLVSCQA